MPGMRYVGGSMLAGLLPICLAALSWGTTGATMAILARDAAAGPLLVGWARMAVAAACLVPAAIVAVTVRRLSPDRTPRARLAASPWTMRDVAGCLGLGAAMAAYQVCYFRAVTLTGLTVTAVLAICSAPLWIALLAALCLGERLSRLVRLALALAVAGTALLVAAPTAPGASASGSLLGPLLGLGAGLSYAAYAVTAKGLLARRPPLAVAAATFSLAALLLLPTALAPGAGAALGAGWPLFLYLGVGPTAIAYWLFGFGLARVPATVAGIATLLEPLTATALGVLWFGERLGPTGWLGALLLCAAFAALARAGARHT